MDNITKTFLSNTYTTSQIRSRLQILRDFLQKKYFSTSSHPGGEQSEPIGSKDSIASARGSLIASLQNDEEKGDNSWLKSLGEGFFKQFNATNTTKLLEELEQNLKKITPLVIYIPFEMPEEGVSSVDSQVNRLGIWLRKTIGPDVVFETKLDPNLIGGCALSWKGVLRDYSLRAKIENQKSEILASLKKELH